VTCSKNRQNRKRRGDGSSCHIDRRIGDSNSL